jgi:hypothetical protein
MRPGRSWDVPDEFWRFWWGHRQLRKIIMQVNVEPARKGPAGRRSAPEFQRQVMDQMENSGAISECYGQPREHQPRTARQQPSATPWPRQNVRPKREIGPTET